MVRLFFFVLVVCFALVGCGSRRDFVLAQHNDMLDYLNYQETTAFEFPFNAFENNPVSSITSFDVKDQKIRNPFIGNDSKIIREILDDFFCYNLKYDGCGYHSNDSTSRVGVFFCGKLSLVDSVSSYLVLTELPDDRYVFIGDYFRDLYLLNYKNNRLTSIVKLSTHKFSDDERTMVVTYLVEFETIPRSHLFAQINFPGFFLDYRIVDHLPEQAIQAVSGYVKIKKKSKTLRFSNFAIDEKGFVVFI